MTNWITKRKDAVEVEVCVGLMAFTAWLGRQSKKKLPCIVHVYHTYAKQEHSQLTRKAKVPLKELHEEWSLFASSRMGSRRV